MYGRLSKNIPMSLKNSVEFGRFIYKRVKHNRSNKNAASLTFTSLFAVVPFMTLSYALLSAIPELHGVGEQLQQLVFSTFVPEAGEMVQGHLKQFSSQAKNLSLFGIVFLLVTAFMMMKAIEDDFNKIWQVPEGRKGVNSFLLYWSVLTLGPLLMGMGMILSSYLASLPLWNDDWGQKHFLLWLPLILSIGAFTFVYMLVPNTRVPWKHALMGGVVVAIVFEVAKKSFSAYITAFPSYQLIYGAFAAVPLFLLWIYMSWLILLVGAEIIHGLSIYKPNWKPIKSRPVVTLLGVLSSLYRAQRKGEGIELSELQRSLSYAHEEDMDMALTWLLDEKVVVNLPTGELMLSRDVSSFTLYDLLARFPWPLPAPEYVGDNNASQQWLVRFGALLEVHQTQQIELLNVSLKAFFDEDESEVDKES